MASTATADYEVKYLCNEAVVSSLMNHTHTLAV